MIFRSSIGRMVDGFSAQFEVEDGQLVYRSWSKGPPVPVSERERDKFVAAFKRRVYIAFGSFLAAFSALIACVIAISIAADVSADSYVFQIALWVSIIAPAAAFMFYILRLQSFPARQLRRATIGEARSRREMRRIQLDRMNYGQLAAGAAFIAWLAWQHRNDDDFTHYLFLGLAAIMLPLAAVQAVRKAILERR